MSFWRTGMRTAFFDSKVYQELVDDDSMTGDALSCVLLSGFLLGLGLKGGSLVGAFMSSIFLLSLLVVFTIVIFLISNALDGGYDFEKMFRLSCFATAPGWFGIVGVANSSLAEPVILWTFASCLFAGVWAVRKRGSLPLKIAAGTFALIFVFPVLSRVLSNGLGMIVVITLVLFHKPILIWGREVTSKSIVSMSLFGRIASQTGRAQGVIKRKGMSVTVGELAELFTFFSYADYLAKMERSKPAEQPNENAGEPDPKEGEKPPFINRDPVDKAADYANQPPPEAAVDYKAEASDEPSKEPPPIPPTETTAPVEAVKKEDSPEDSVVDEKAPDVGEDKSSNSVAEAEPELSSVTDEENSTNADGDKVAEPESAPKPEIESTPVEAPPVAKEPKPDLTKASAVEVNAGPKVGDVCAALFNEELSGYEATERFKERYLEEEATWTGKVIEAEGYTYDTVFGSDPGVKLVVEVAEVKTDYGTLPVEAVVSLPMDQLASLQAKVGERVAFSGKFKSVDPYMRRIYLAEGELRD